ncbi:MAG: MotA/TolQ/ExbB proton channel family protein [Candidatus Electryonea clarkiae]|nr:MotA/TolQ/ExbB proton channel family protein [Candidatus Electryonea clarkiae]MDP8286051.1 MotA/TolQ/ExbB proton channel family protein [Candidatus Electryonea clarkiae]
MKITSIFGLLFGFGLVFVAIYSKGNISDFISPSSLLIVFGGTLGATMLSFNYDQLVTAVRAFPVVFIGKTSHTDDLIPIMVELIKHVRIEGVGNIEIPEEDSDRMAFLRKAMELLEDGFEPDVAAQILKAESDTIAAKYRMSERLFNVMGTYTPLFGLLGTLIGLIIMLSSVSDPMAIPGAMAVALITTFYGVLFSAMIFRPVAAKIRAWNYDEIMLRELIIETLVYIAEGTNSSVAQERLLSYYQTKR